MAQEKHTCFKKKQRCVYTLTCNEICKEKFVGLSSKLFTEEIWSDWDSKGIFIFTPAVSCVVNIFHKYAHPAVLISGPMKVCHPAHACAENEKMFNYMKTVSKPTDLEM